MTQANVSPRMAQQLLHLGRGAPLDLRDHVRVALLREGELRVTECLLDDLGVHVPREHQAGRGVSEVVEALAPGETGEWLRRVSAGDDVGLGQPAHR